LMVSLGLHSHYTFVYELLQGNKKYFVVVEYASREGVFLTLTYKSNQSTKDKYNG